MIKDPFPVTYLLILGLETIEVIASEVEEGNNSNNIAQPYNAKSIKDKYAKYPVISHNDSKFNRDEANNYK